MMHITSGSRLKSIVPVAEQNEILGSIDKRGSAIYIEREIERDEMT